MPTEAFVLKMLISGIIRQAEKPVLENIIFQLNSGETIGIMGGTGSAKQVLLIF